MTTGFHVSSPRDVLEGRVADVYFRRGEEVLRSQGVNPLVVAEVRAASLPRDWRWATLAAKSNKRTAPEDATAGTMPLPHTHVQQSD